MSEIVQVLVILGIFLGFLAFLIAVVILNPNRVKVEAKKENDEALQEVSITLDSDEKQKS